MIKIALYYSTIFILTAQIGGLSGSKLVSLCVDVVDHHKLEFEPLVGFSSTNQFWNSSGKLKRSFSTLDSVSYSSELSFRITYGLFNSMEIGVAFPADGSYSNWGIRYILADNDAISFAIIAGLNIPTSNDVHNSKIYTENNTNQYGIGGVSTAEINENFSVDATIQYNYYSNTLENSLSSLFSISTDAGHYFYDKQLQVIAAINYQKYNSDLGAYLFTFTPGVTVETGDSYIIILYSSFDIMGENIEKSNTVGLGLTLTFD